MMPFCKLERYEGNESLFELVMMSIVSSLVGEPLHVHAEGLRGTGKTTIMRSARGILPNITRIKNCIYNCDPDHPHCPHHRDLTAEQVAQLGTEEIPMPFLEISHSAKVGTVAGSIDLARLTDSGQPEARLLPGLIPQAHRGVIFIDEINRLADTAPEITDILLDVMGNKPGHIQIEEAGLPVVEIPVSVSVWAASNPDEDPGPLEEIRRQLSDRFDMVCYMGRPDSVDILAQMLRENSHAFKNRQPSVKDNDGQGNEVYRKNIAKWAGIYETADLPDFLRNFIARLYIKHNLESIRAIEAMQQGAVLHSIIKGHDKVLINDVTDMIPLVLKHRVDGDTLVRMINDVDSKSAKDGILTFKGRKNKAKKESEPEYFQQNARPLKEMSRDELINTEKTLTPSDF